MHAMRCVCTQWRASEGPKESYLRKSVITLGPAMAGKIGWGGVSCSGGYKARGLSRSLLSGTRCAALARTSMQWQANKSFANAHFNVAKAIYAHKLREG